MNEVFLEDSNHNCRIFCVGIFSKKSSWIPPVPSLVESGKTTKCTQICKADSFQTIPSLLDILLDPLPLGSMQTVSIITVVFNAREDLKATMESVFAQTYPGIEYVVVDGASTDGTVDLIEAHADRIHTWVSEPDKGLYDAMSKAIQLATGDFLWFVNAGDLIYRPDTLENIMKAALPDTDVLFGEVMIVDENGRELGTRSARTTRKLPQRLTWKSMRYGMVVCHQGFLARRSLAEPYQEGNWVADLDWVIRILKKSRRNTFVPGILASFQEGGVSTQKRKASLKDRYRVLQEHFGWLPNLLAHVYILIRAAIFALRSR
jgi:glycosyltransferase involved in cell wall biosynthesis